MTKNKFDEMREYLKNNKQFEGIQLPQDDGFITALEKISNNSTVAEKKSMVDMMGKKYEEQGQGILVVGLMKMLMYDLLGLDRKDLEEEFKKIDPEKIKSDVEELKKKINYKEKS